MCVENVTFNVLKFFGISGYHLPKNGFIPVSGHKDPRKRHLFDIPLKELPCPQEERPTEAPRTQLHTPAYAGINASGAGMASLAPLILIWSCFINLT